MQRTVVVKSAESLKFVVGVDVCPRRSRLAECMSCEALRSSNSTVRNQELPSSTDRNSHSTMAKARSPRQILSTLFSSLARDTPQWILTRTLKSDNPMDINGVLRGTATFTPLRDGESDTDLGEFQGSEIELVYREEGEIPASADSGVSSPMSGLRWTKKYIWRLDEQGSQMSVWFAKVGQQKDEADYLFHKFKFKFKSDDQDNVPGRQDSDSRLDDAHPIENGDDYISPVTPPLPLSMSPSVAAEDAGKGCDTTDTTVLIAYGDHLCVKDMYYTAYAFRIRSTGEVVSWSSRHIVKGPRKNQDIVNLYERGG